MQIKKNSLSTSKLYVEVPYELRNEVKLLKVRWDPSFKSWYVTDNHNQQTIKSLLDLKAECTSKYNKKYYKNVRVPKAFLLSDKTNSDSDSDDNSKPEAVKYYQNEEVLNMFKDKEDITIPQKNKITANIFKRCDILDDIINLDRDYMLNKTDSECDL